MIVALDYDRTYTADPDLWLLFIQSATARGHTVYCATQRAESDPVDEALAIAVEGRVVYTNRKAKRWLMEARGIAVDVWIDDSPAGIYCDRIGARYVNGRWQRARWSRPTPQGTPKGGRR